MKARELRMVLDVLWDCGHLDEQPTYDVFMDILDAINKGDRENLKRRIKEEMVEGNA